MSDALFGPGEAALRRAALDGMFKARSIALIGASDRNNYSFLAAKGFERIGFDGKAFMVNRRGAPAHGHPGFVSCQAIGEPIDAAYLCVPIAGAIDALKDALAAGARNIVAVTSGFAEVGGAGVERQAEALRLCREAGANLLGPNCLGFLNFADKVAIASMYVEDDHIDGGVAIISASGATARHLMLFAYQQGVGVSHVVATGNEADISSADLIDYLVDQPKAKVIALFQETVGDAGRFAAAVERARLAQKPVVVLKVGANEATAAVAKAHTGALVGDDKVFDAACHRYGIVRVQTFEDLIITAAVLVRPCPACSSGQGVGFISISGGGCEVVSDLAQAQGVSMPTFAPETKEALKSVVSDLGQVLNPIDLTGAAIPDPTMWERTAALVTKDPGIGLAVIHWDLPTVENPRLPDTYEHVILALDAAKPSLLVTTNVAPVNQYGRAYVERAKTPLAIPGLGHGMFAVGKLSWWSKRLYPAPRAGAAVDPAVERRPSRHRA